MHVFVSEELCLGVIIGPHGIKGAVRVKSFTEIPESIAEYGTLHDKNGKSFDLRLDGQSKGLLIASIKGMTSRNQAEVLKGTELFIKRKLLPNTDDGEYYHADLLALNVYEPDGKKMGVVKAMHNFGAGDIVEVAIGETEKTVLIPFNNNTVIDIDFVKQKMIVEIPLGLLD